MFVHLNALTLKWIFTMREVVFCIGAPVCMFAYIYISESWPQNILTVALIIYLKLFDKICGVPLFLCTRATSHKQIGHSRLCQCLIVFQTMHEDCDTNGYVLESNTNSGTAVMEPGQ